MWDHPQNIAFAIGTVLVFLGILAWLIAGYRRRLTQANSAHQPLLIDLAAESTEGVDDSRPTWLVLTSAVPAWNADDVAAICSRVWNVPVNEDEHDFNFVIGEAPCMMLRHGDWHYLLTIGDEPYMDPEQIPMTDDAALRNAFAAQQSWFSLSVVGVPDHETLHGKEALQRSAQLVAALTGELGLVVMGINSPEPKLWTTALAATLQRGEF